MWRYKIKPPTEPIDSGVFMGEWKHKLSNINLNSQTAECVVCGVTSIYIKGKKNPRCKTAHQSTNHNNRGRQLRQRLMNNSCQICGSEERLCLDHDHTTGFNRGTLCNNCNAAIGLLKDNVKIVLMAAEYLQNYKSHPNYQDGIKFRQY